jgi:phosphocarrier protein
VTTELSPNPAAPIEPPRPPTPGGERLRESIHEIIGEDEFLGLLRPELQGLFLIHNSLVRTPRPEWAKRHFFRLISEANEVETFLDDFGARNSRSFQYLRELTASVRGFASACHVLKHLDLRLTRYALELPPPRLAAFREDLARSLEFACEALGRLLADLTHETERLGCAIPTGVVADGQLVDALVERKLPNNLEDGDAVAGDAAARVADLAGAYRECVRRISRIPAGPFEGHAALLRFQETEFREENVRTLETLVHNLQSKYDTYLRSTPQERRSPTLPVLRGHASVALHLLEFAILLVHFYERHENDIRSEATKEAIARLVDKDVVLDRAIRFAFAWAREFLLQGKDIAERLLEEFTHVQSVEIPLQEGSVLHARPATLIVTVVNRYGTPVEMEIDGERANAGSIMQVMILAGTKPGARTVTFRGDVHPLRDLELLFAAGLGENGTAGFPDELAYLRE